MPEEDPPAIRRRVALRALREARAAWRVQHKRPTEKNVRAAFYACTLARQTLLRMVGEDHPPDEQELIEESWLIGEAAIALNRKLGGIIDAHT